MKLHRRILVPIAGLITLLTVMTACGPGNAAISGKTPSQVLAAALSKLTGQSFKFTAHFTLKVDLSKVSGFKESDLGAFGPVASDGVTVTLNGSVESKTRASIHIKLTPLCDGDIYFEEYDGKSYMSDDGKTWYPSGTNTPSADKTNEKADEQSLTKVGFQDKGSTTQDGQTVQDYRLDFDNKLINKIATAAGQAAAASAITQVLTVNGDGVDIYIRPNDGLPESVKGTLKLTVNVTQLVALLSLFDSSGSSTSQVPDASGSLGLTISTDDRFTDYAKTTVTKPTAAGGTAPNPCANLSGLTDMFGGLGGTTSGSGSLDSNSGLSSN